MQTNLNNVVQFSTKSSKGFFMLSNSLFDHEFIKEISGDALRVFLWLTMQAYRFKDNSGLTRASYRYISLKTGVSLSTVSRSIEQLIALNLIRKDQTDLKFGITWWVSPVLFSTSENERTNPQKEIDSNTQNNCIQKEHIAYSKEAHTVPNLSTECIQIEHNIKNNNNIKNLYLSKKLEDSDTLNAYFKNLRPFRKNQSEMFHFNQLTKEYSVLDIEKGFIELKKQDPNLIKFHSPMGYLAFSIDIILKKIDDEKKRDFEKNKKINEVLNLKQSKNDQIDIEIQQMEQAFYSTFRSLEDQNKAIIEYSKGTKAKLPQLVKSIAINKWWSEHTKKIESY